MSYDSIQYGITEEFQTLVVDGPSLLLPSDAFMHQRLLIILDIARIESDDLG